MGAIASGGVQVLNDDVVRHLRDAEKLIPFTAEHEWRELRRREEEYRDGRPAPNLAGKTVILVDDGLATSSTMRAAVLALRKCDVAALVVAVPIGAPEIWVEFQHEVDEAICLAAPPDFQAVGQFYEDFRRRPIKKCASCWRARRRMGCAHEVEAGARRGDCRASSTADHESDGL